MCVWKLLFVVISVGYAICGEGPLLHPCKSTDIQCLRGATQQFLEKTSKGIPQHDILPIDPIIIPELEIKIDENEGALVKLSNINVTGLKNQDISDFRMDTKEKSVLLSTGAQVDITCDISIKLAAKVYNGIFHANANVLGNSTYNYELKTGPDGTEHFIVGPETIVGQLHGKPDAKTTFSEDSIKDPDFKATSDRWKSKVDDLRALVIKKIIEEAYVTVIHNIRAAAKLLPKTAFFVDV